MKLKHLAPYLPYNLPLYRQNKQGEWKVIHMNNGNIMLPIENPENCKPLLRPLSDLTKEIEYNGQKFIPIVELLKISQTDHKYNLTAKYDIIKYWSDIGGLGGEYFSIRYSWESSNDITVVADLMYDTVFNRFTLRQKQPLEKCQWLQYDVLEEKLLEWHFDKFKLLPSGLGISYHDIK